MRKKLLFFLSITIILTGCWQPKDTDVTKYFTTQTGYIYIATLIEVKSNFSSLLFDKTKAKEEDFYSSKYATINKDALIKVLPVKISDPFGKRYDDKIKTILKNYISVNNFANVTESNTNNDFYLVASVKESLSNSMGKNFSFIEITILDKNNKPYFFTKVKMVSKSDKNFWYYPSKDAKPVSYLTLKGFEHIFQKSLYKAFKES